MHWRRSRIGRCTVADSVVERDARVCTCGHTGHWHSAVILSDTEYTDVPMGEGECEASGECECKRFVLDHVDTLDSLRGERDRAVKQRDEELWERVEDYFRYRHQDREELFRVLFGEDDNA